MNWKTSRNEKHKYFNKEKLDLGEITVHTNIVNNVFLMVRKGKEKAI